MTKRIPERILKPIEELYAGYFSSEKYCDIFAKHVPKEIYALKNPVVVDAGSGRGTLGGYIKKEFFARGFRVRLVMVDIDRIALEQSHAKALKIEGGLTKNPLSSSCANLVVLRSVLQYEDERNQAKILREIFRILKPGGVFISQFGVYKNQKQADAINRIFSFAGSKVFFCGKKEGISLHKKIFGNAINVSNGTDAF